MGTGHQISERIIFRIAEKEEENCDQFDCG